MKQAEGGLTVPPGFWATEPFNSVEIWEFVDLIKFPYGFPAVAFKGFFFDHVGLWATAVNVRLLLV